MLKAPKRQRKIARKKPARSVCSYDEICAGTADANAIAAQASLRLLRTKYRLSEIDLQIRIEYFKVFAHYGSGRHWRDRFNIDRKRAGRLAQRLREDAEDLRRALTPLFKHAIGGPLSADIVCDIINRSASWIEVSLRETNDRTAEWTVQPKRELTEYVWWAAGKPLDKELANIITAILGLERYTAEEQRKFRERHCKIDGSGSAFFVTSVTDKIDPIKA